MKFFLLIIVGLAVFAYLFLSYVRFYHLIGKENLQRPYTQEPIILVNPQGNGTATYVVLGDSLSAGVGSSTIQDTFPYRYAEKLLEQYKEVKIVNIAQPGGMTTEVIENQISRAITQKPDYITLLIGTNDMHNKKTVTKFRKNYQYILDELLMKTDAHITVITVPYIGSPKVVYFPFNDVMNFRIRQFNTVISNVVNASPQRNRITFIDLYTKTYTEFKKDGPHYASDLFHPSNAGYILWSKIINAD